MLQLNLLSRHFTLLGTFTAGADSQRFDAGTVFQMMRVDGDFSAANFFNGLVIGTGAAGANFWRKRVGCHIGRGH